MLASVQGTISKGSIKVTTSERPMPELPSVFISYNPHSEFEQTLAIRLYTIGAVHGLNMLMPDRSHSSENVSVETRSRIRLADFFIVFSTGVMSKTVLEEISIAISRLKDRSKILIVYEKGVGKKIPGSRSCTEVFVDPGDEPLKLMTVVVNGIKAARGKRTNRSLVSSVGGLLLIGLGLFVMGVVSCEGSKPRKKTVVKGGKL